MKHRITICAGLAALAVAGATSAQAQAVYVEPPRGYVAVSPPTMEPMIESGLAPNEILMIVRASGLRPLTQPARRGGRYLILASDNMGGQLRVVINAHTGRIVAASPADDPRFTEHPVRPRGLVPVPPPQQDAEAPSSYMPPPPDLRSPSAPPPPARVARTTPPQNPASGRSTNHTLANAPDVTGSTSARPARTPLPRPRPAAATQQAAAPAPAPEAPATPAPQAQPTVTETSPEAEPAATAAPAPSAAPATPPASETRMVPVAPLD